MWVLLFIQGVCNVFCWTFKILGFRYDDVNKLASIFYLESLFCFLYDLFIFNTSFHYLSLIGIIALLVFFVGKVTYILNDQPPQKLAK